MGKPVLVYIEWCDAVSDGSASWHTKDEAVDWAGDDWVVQQAGYIVKETKEYILLASKFNAHSQEGDSRYSGLLKIPKPWIKKREDIRLKSA